jgi:hypothetical protein
MEFFEKLIECL